MKLRTTLILVSIALGLGLFILILDRRIPNRRTLEASSSNVVTVEPRAVVHVRIQNGDSTVDLRRAGDGWAMDAPIRDQADAAAIEHLLDEVHFLRQQG